MGSTTTVTLPLPSVNANAYTSGPAMRACTSGSCATTGSFTTIVLTDDSSLPSWITTANSNTELSIAPTSGTVKSSNPWVVKVVYTPTAGSNNPAYTAVTITVTCEITSWSMSGAGSTSISYNVFARTTVIDATTIVYTQSPACGYTFTNSFTYTIPAGNASSVVSQGGYMTPSFNVFTSNTALTGTYSLTLANTITVDSGQGQSTTTFSGNDQSYSLTVSNPCPTTTIAAITFNPSSITVTDG